MESERARPRFGLGPVVRPHPFDVEGVHDMLLAMPQRFHDAGVRRVSSAAGGSGVAQSPRNHRTPERALVRRESISSRRARHRGWRGKRRSP
jgi:hypothetical protein